MLENEALVETAFRTGKGVGWGEQSPCLFCTVGRFFRPSYHTASCSPGCRRWTA